MAKIFNKTSPGPDDHTLILAVRELFYEGFEATNWTDLRVGFLLSICGNADPGEDDNIVTGIGPETIGTGTRPLLPWTDRFAIGLTDKATGRTFCGFTNAPPGRVFDAPQIGKSILTESDIGIGTTGDYWRPTHETSDYYSLQMIDDGITRTESGDGSQIHLVKDFSGGHAAGYATLLMLRFTRADAFGRAKIITMSTMKTPSGHSADVLFTSSTIDSVLESNIASLPASMQTFGPIEMSQVPDTFYVYWPFFNSRIRIHNYGIKKIA